MDTEVAIEVEDLCKTYGRSAQSVEAVRGISLKIKKGELFGFLGPNGAGKTTSLKMMIGLLNPTRGKVLILGKNPKEKKNASELKRKIGIIPQDITVYEDLTVEENMWFMAKIYRLSMDNARERIENLINRIGLEEKRKALARNLSGGQKRRLNLIMSIIHDPEIILCDEPTPGLDPQSSVKVWEFIKDLTKREKRTVVLTTHLMEEADRLSDRVAIIDKGKILVIDTPAKLKASIGEGDLLEIVINNKDKLDEAKEDLSKFKGVQEVIITNDRLIVRCLDAVSKMATLLNTVENIGVEIEHLGMRNTTLEDVFIHLTGKTLRE
ncbi:MAG: ATP-binding cassette domain-containing protein [Candidatus Hodarchaeota archaeon]